MMPLAALQVAAPPEAVDAALLGKASSMERSAMIIKNLVEVGMDAVELRTTHKHGVETS
jgi:hypothetical protein